MSVDRPERVMFQETIDGVLFFIDKNDDWFFRGYNVVVDYDEELHEPTYIFSEEA